MATINEHVFEKILRRLAEGESLTQICRDKDMPHRWHVMQFMSSERPCGPERLERYRRARELAAESFVDRILEECDAAHGESAEQVAARRLKVDSLKWIACKLHPRTFGERQQIEHTGDAPLILNITKG